jgi:hypothetical protein
LEDGVNLAGEDLTGHELERHLYWLSCFEIAGINLLDLNADLPLLSRWRPSRPGCAFAKMLSFAN